MAPKVRIAVVGAGIGGLAAVLALTPTPASLSSGACSWTRTSWPSRMHPGPNGSRILPAETGTGISAHARSIRGR